MGEQAGTTTPTDSRSQRIQASRRGGQLLTRTQSPTYKNGLPNLRCSRMPLSRTVAPYSPPQTPTGIRAGEGAGSISRSFIRDTNAIEALNRQLRKAIKTKGHFPNEDAARKLVGSICASRLTSISESTMGEQAGTTTPTDSRSQRIQASRRGGQLLTRTQSPTYKNGLPNLRCSRMPLSRTVAPYSPPQTPTGIRAGEGAGSISRSFIRDTNAIEALNRQLRKAIKTKGHFPNEDAARKLIYLAVLNAVAAMDPNEELDGGATRLQNPLRRPNPQLTPRTQKTGHPPSEPTCSVPTADMEIVVSSMKGRVVSRGRPADFVFGCALAGVMGGSGRWVQGFRGCAPELDRRIAGRGLTGQAPCAGRGDRRRRWRLTRQAASGSRWVLRYGARVVGRRRIGCGPAGGGVAPVIHPVALGGPECRAVLRGSIKWSAVLG